MTDEDRLNRLIDLEVRCHEMRRFRDLVDQWYGSLRYPTDDAVVKVIQTALQDSRDVFESEAINHRRVITGPPRGL